MTRWEQGKGSHYMGAAEFLRHVFFHGTKSYIDIIVEDPLPSYRLKTYILSNQMLNCSSLDTGHGTLGINKRRLLKYGLNTLSSAVWWLWSQNRFASLHFYFYICFPFGQGGSYLCRNHIPASQPQALPCSFPDAKYPVPEGATVDRAPHFNS